jgi:ribosomal-protein-alanine N-acetyltransferase
MAFVITELAELAPVRDALLKLSKINSPDLDVDAEARLPHARFWITSETAHSDPLAYALVWLVGNEIEIIYVATAPEQRRRGAARALLVRLLDTYAGAAREAAFLEVRAGNQAAIGLYSGLDFERMRVRRGYYSNGEDAVEMRRDLSRPRPAPSAASEAGDSAMSHGAKT